MKNVAEMIKIPLKNIHISYRSFNKSCLFYSNFSWKLSHYVIFIKKRQCIFNDPEYCKNILTNVAFTACRKRKNIYIYECTCNGFVSAKNIYYPAGIQTDWNLKKINFFYIIWIFPPKKAKTIYYTLHSCRNSNCYSQKFDEWKKLRNWKSKIINII